MCASIRAFFSIVTTLRCGAHFASSSAHWPRSEIAAKTTVVRTSTGYAGAAGAARAAAAGSGVAGAGSSVVVDASLSAATSAAQTSVLPIPIASHSQPPARSAGFTPAVPPAPPQSPPSRARSERVCAGRGSVASSPRSTLSMKASDWRCGRARRGWREARKKGGRLDGRDGRVTCAKAGRGREESTGRRAAHGALHAAAIRHVVTTCRVRRGRGAVSGGAARPAYQRLDVRSRART